MSGAQFDEMREAGLLVIDYPGRKLAVYPSTSGQVVLASWDGAETQHTVLEPDEAVAVCRAILNTGAAAAEISRELDAEYTAHAAIQDAKDGPSSA